LKIINKILRANDEILGSLSSLLMSVSNFILLKQLISFLGITSFGVFNYFTTVLIASMSLTDFGINNSLTTKVFTTKNTKEISSVLLFSIFFQILILITLVLIWKNLDSRLAIYNYNLIIFITIVIFFSKKAWGIVSSALLSIYNVRPLLYISITYTFISLFLLIFDYQLTLEKYLSVQGLIFIAPFIYIIKTFAPNFKVGFDKTLSLVRKFITSSLFFLLTNIFSLYAIWFERDILIDSIGLDGQAIFGIGILCINMLSVLLNGALKVSWSKGGNDVFLELLKSKKFLIYCIPIFTIFNLIISYLIIIFFELKFSTSTYTFFMLMFFSSPFLLLNQLISINFYAKNKFINVSKVGLMILLLNILLLLVLKYEFIVRINLVVFAFKIFIIHLITFITLTSLRK
tara:strand:- start:790 stop:1998 length:1209 start_codon:yes stop_codon:yes gene_type:complete